jgi:RNA polymerase sigma factor (sigma-70 family)
MDSRTDQELLQEYAGGGSETAFTEVVRRHVDFVYSTALRLAGNAHLAEDVSQRVFLALAQNARQLTDRAVLCGWLHCTTRNLSANAVRSEVRRRAREQEAAAMNELLAPDHQPGWESIAPYLDAALSELSELDRDALLLRYFQRKSAREMAQELGISGEAAQKRLNRAIERLRDLFIKRGIPIGATGLVALISANAVQAAPVGLPLGILAAALSGATVPASTAITTTKILAMTTLQKAVILSAITAVVGAGIYQTRRGALPREQTQARPDRQSLMARNEVSQLAPDASANISAESLSRGRPATSRPPLVRSKNAPAAGGFVSSELYALLTNKQSRLTLAQVEPYLTAKGRSAASLLAAFRTTKERALLAEAVQKYPHNPQVAFEGVIQNAASPQARRAALDAFKQAAPENSLANYLSALEHFKAGQKDEAVQDLNAAAAKAQFQDYMLDRTRTDEEVYRSAGYPPGEAQMVANSFLPEPQLSQVREVGQNLVSVAAAYEQAGDQSSRETALQMALELGQRFDNPAAAETMRWQLIGIRVERAALSVMDPASSLAGTGQLVRDRLDQLARQMETIQELTRQADPLWKTLSDEDWTGFHAQMDASGEEAAVRWLVINYGRR